MARESHDLGGIDRWGGNPPSVQPLARGEDIDRAEELCVAEVVTTKLWGYSEMDGFGA